MVTDIYVCLAPVNMLPACYFVWDKVEFAEQPRPKSKKGISDMNSLIAKQSWDQKRRKEQYHEKDEYEQHPNNIEVMKDFQAGKFGVKIKRKPYAPPFK